jgi:uncharacterized membrane protein
MGSGSRVINSLGVGSGVGANNLLGVTLGVDLLFGSDFENIICIVYISLVLQKAVYLFLCGQKDIITLSANVASNFTIDGKT